MRWATPTLPPLPDQNRHGDRRDHGQLDREGDGLHARVRMTAAEQRRRDAQDRDADGDQRACQHRPPHQAGSPGSDESQHKHGDDDGAEGGEDEHACHRHRRQHRVIDRVGAVPSPPMQMWTQLVEDFVAAVVHEADADSADDDATIPEHPETTHDLEGEADHRRVQGDDVQRQPVEEELHGEDVVREPTPS